MTAKELKNLKAGDMLAWRKEWGQIRRLRVDEIIRHRNKIHSIQCSFGRGFDQTVEVPGYRLDWEILDYWDNYREKERQAKAHRQRLQSLQENIQDALRPLGISCVSTVAGSIRLEGNITDLESLATILSTMNLEETSALEALFS